LHLWRVLVAKNDAAGAAWLYMVLQFSAHPPACPTRHDHPGRQTPGCRHLPPFFTGSPLTPVVPQLASAYAMRAFCNCCHARHYLPRAAPACLVLRTGTAAAACSNTCPAYPGGGAVGDCWLPLRLVATFLLCSALLRFLSVVSGYPFTPWFGPLRTWFCRVLRCMPAAPLYHTCGSFPAWCCPPHFPASVRTYHARPAAIRYALLHFLFLPLHTTHTHLPRTFCTHVAYLCTTLPLPPRSHILGLTAGGGSQRCDVAGAGAVRMWRTLREYSLCNSRR